MRQRQSEHISDQYKDILNHYLQRQDEKALYHGQNLSHKMLEQKISPEEVLSLHINVLKEIFTEMPREYSDSFDFLLEIMVGYGVAYHEHQSLRNRQQQLELDIEVAANMQQMLLQSKPPQSDKLDIGVLSQPAKKMNGDYYHFVQDDNECVSIAIADIIGKGIPAALSMSMIKFAMDSVPEQRLQPSAILESLNRVVEENVDPGMFITMLYGIYDPRVNRFYYAGAGHEPGFFYSARNNKFKELYAKGLVLGASRTTRYREFEKDLHPGDMIILLSDGVTECRTEKGFIEREEITALIQKDIDFSAQEIVNRVYNELTNVQGFELRDDFTLMILRRTV